MKTKTNENDYRMSTLNHLLLYWSNVWRH